MQNFIKFFLLILFVACTTTTLANTWDTNTWEKTNPETNSIQNTWTNIEKEEDKCLKNKYVLEWNFNIKKNTLVEFNTKLEEDIKSDFIKKIEYNLYKNDEKKDLIKSYTGDVFSYKFPQKWKYQLNAKIFEKNWCSYKIQKDINVYEQLLFYIWETFENSLQFNKIDIGEGKFHIHMENVFLDKNSFFSKNALLNKLSNSIYYLKNSEKIILNTQWPKLGSIFETFGSMSKLYNTEIWKKEICVITDMNSNFLNRILAKYTKIIWAQKISIIQKDNLFNFLFNIWNEENQKYKKIFSISIEDTPKYLFLSYIIDILIYNWFPTELLVLMLSLAISALLISFFRQVIWFSVFGVYNPLLFAVSILVLWTKFSFILLFISFISTLLIRAFSKKVYLLYSAKISLLIIIYFLVTIFFLWANNILRLDLINYDIFSNSFIIFPIIVVILIANKVFHEGFSLFSKGWWFHFIEFLIVTFSVYFLISRVSFQNLILSYPEILFLIIILNIGIWRFTWLQLLEYFRFMPLIKKHLEE